MLESMRKHSKSFVIKILFGMLILSFAVWGVGDMVRTIATDTAAATVGDSEVSLQQVQYEYRRQLEQFQRSGIELDSDQARAMRMLDAVVDNLVARQLLLSAAQDLGVGAGSELVRASIKSNPNFAGPGGQFDRLTFQQVLANNNLNETSYAALLTQDLIRQPLNSVVSQGAVAPRELARRVNQYRGEIRRLETVEIKAETITDIAAATAADLAAYHTENADRYMAPEYRKFAAINMTLTDFAKNVDVPEERITEAYGDRSVEFIVPEMRAVEQMVFNDKETANKGHRRIVGGENFADVGKDMLNLERSDLSLGSLSRDQLPSELQAPAFALATGAVSEPIESALGWHILRLTGIQAGTTKSLEEVRTVLRDDIARELAIEVLYDTATQLEDTVAGGATLEEAARQLNLKLLQVDAADARGFDRDDKKIADMPTLPKFMQTLFTTDSGTDSPLTDADDAYFIIRVDDIIAPAVRPLDKIKGLVDTQWQRDQRMARVKEKAEAALERATGGASLAELATETGGVHTAATAILRNGTLAAGGASGLPGQLVQSAFDTAEGNAAMSEGNDAYVIARVLGVDKVTSPDPEAIEALAGQMKNGIVGEVINELIAALRAEYGVTVNRSAIDALY